MRRGTSPVPRIQVIIPTYNERENIRRILRAVEEAFEACGYEGRILVVDDSSPDGTGDEVRAIGQANNRIYLLSRERKLGLGTAYLDGFRWAIKELNPDIYVQMDADLSHPPLALSALVPPILDGFDVVIGSRYTRGGGSEGWPWYRRFTSRVANWIVRNVLGLAVGDATSGYRALSRKAVEALLEHPPRSKGYAFQIESLSVTSARGLRAKEVPFVFKKREVGSTKLSTRELFAFLWAVIRIRLRGI